jgi:hypothetical protein
VVKYGGLLVDVLARRSIVGILTPPPVRHGLIDALFARSDPA